MGRQRDWYHLQLPHFTDVTTIQDCAKETHFTKIGKQSCNGTQWVCIKKDMHNSRYLHIVSPNDYNHEY
jgi:hypothetical protein